MATSGLRTDLEDLPTPPRWLVWAETLVLTAAPPSLGLWLSPRDPLFIDARFPWLVLAPLLLGLRHGFARALASTLVLCAGGRQSRFDCGTSSSTGAGFRGCGPTGCIPDN